MSDVMDSVARAIDLSIECGETASREAARAAVDAVIQHLNEHLSGMELVFGPPKDIDHLMGRIKGTLSTEPSLDMY